MIIITNDTEPNNEFSSTVSLQFKIATIQSVSYNVPIPIYNMSYSLSFKFFEYFKYQKWIKNWFWTKSTTVFLKVSMRTVPSKYLSTLKIISKNMNIDLDKGSEADIRDYVYSFERSFLSDWTKHNYKVSLKKFYRWLNGEDSFLHYN